MSAAPVDLVAIDVGNTAIKAATFSVSDPLRPLQLFRTSSRDPDFDALDGWLPAEIGNGVAVASVYREGARRCHDWLRVARPNIKFRQLATDDFALPVNVRFPERVGLDRLAAAVTANRIREPHRPAIIVDAGSAITVDCVDHEGVFQGGAILPGWKTMARSLEQSTDQLPLLSTLDFAKPPEVIGRSTEEAIASGLYWGSVGAVRELVQKMIDATRAKESIEPHLFVSGGDMQTLAQYFHRPHQCVAEMALCGIATVVAQFES